MLVAFCIMYAHGMVMIMYKHWQQMTPYTCLQQIDYILLGKSNCYIHYLFMGICNEVRLSMYVWRR